LILSWLIQNGDLISLGKIFTDLDFGGNSSVIKISGVYGFSIHIGWTGSVDGDWKIQVSNDGVNFVTLAGSPITIVAGVVSGTSDTSWMWNVWSAQYSHMRLFWNYTGGSGTLTLAKVNAKG
jgi:hypothetical protein